MTKPAKDRPGNRTAHRGATDEQRRYLRHPASFAPTSSETKERIAAEMPEWMKDPSLLPKRPPGRE